MNFQKVEEQVIIRDEIFAQKAEQLMPRLFEKVVKPVAIVNVNSDPHVIHGWKTEFQAPFRSLAERDFGKNDSFILDFGDHHVGYVSMSVRPVGSPPDAPLALKLTIGEMPVEMAVPFDSYDGWLSSSWLQEETIYVDVLPGVIKLPRRYSFRYIKVEIMATSPKYRVQFDHIECMAVTSADEAQVNNITHEDRLLEKLDEISIKTLADCMHEVFEDGPKRDRRLWLGDLRLQALANYETFKTNDLVKRCLYLFAAVPDQHGRIAANLFVKPQLIADDTYLFDYSLFFLSTLHDYYVVTKDAETLTELWPTAYNQVEHALNRLDENDILKDSPDWWSFIDWQEGLNKQTPSQGVLIYVLKQAIELGNILQVKEREYLQTRLKQIIAATKKHLWDEQKQFFISGNDRQISWASQIWMVSAGVLSAEEGKQLLNRLVEEKSAVGIATPYMYHHLVEALLIAGDRDKAIMEMKNYWGGMLSDGADTFWELYDPNDKTFSPYGSHLINSYCHAWSCTPTYLIRKYDL
ncbi:sugar hydrolase [Niallia circulans]|uniref:Sugar hydrolase n=1 Tax=Niallia circulans TaxID=1397 RepID=A0A553SLR2_NIACI|nr:sugar hydrolase [Niallia circulans]TRZ37928.1 sugar hydrolase [Niallia circulans]